MELANSVYAVACDLFLFAHSLGKHWSIENPTRSLFWLTSFWLAVTQVIDPMYVNFHSCMWGGQRPKRTTSMLELGEVACECDGQHTHLPWGRTPFGFSTASDAAYPTILCEKWASLVSTGAEIGSPGLRASRLSSLFSSHGCWYFEGWFSQCAIGNCSWVCI